MSRAIAVDTSVILAVCLQESGYNAYEDLLETTPELLMSAVTRVELGIVCAARGITEKADQIVQTYAIKIISFDETMALAAIEAFERYGKGRHKASLNFGDCCSYAVAKTRGIPLLYQGDDFALTDVVSALA
jgi:ribonuclease VapC